jgi:hypothetical protein
MRHVRRDEMGDAPLLLELGFERFCEARGGVEPEITARQTQHGHPDGERQTEYLKRATVDDPDTLRNRFEDIMRWVGAIVINLARHPAILLVNGFEAATDLEAASRPGVG